MQPHHLFSWTKQFCTRTAHCNLPPGAVYEARPALLGASLALSGDQGGAGVPPPPSALLRSILEGVFSVGRWGCPSTSRQSPVCWPLSPRKKVSCWCWARMMKKHGPVPVPQRWAAHPALACYYYVPCCARHASPVAPEAPCSPTLHYTVSASARNSPLYADL